MESSHHEQKDNSSKLKILDVISYFLCYHVNIIANSCPDEHP